jgi:protocatechuate 3,4-dioxygenase beta subunit
MNFNRTPTTTHTADDDRHDLGLAYDLGEFQRRFGSAPVAVAGTLDRRNVLKFALVAGFAGAATLGFRRSANGQTTTAAAACTDIPEETAGPYPGDGTNGPNVLTTSGVVRSDITSSFGSMSGRAAGVPLSITLTIVDAALCGPAKGYAVYLWHADQQGRYSLYSSGVTDQNYLRGVQETDASGNVTFKTVFPGCYDGRWPHMHFEVYPSLQAAGDATKRIATSQVALPKAACDLAYVTSGYSASPGNLSKVSLATDGVFGDDGGARELAVLTGTAANGFVGNLNVTVSNTVKSSGGAGGPVGPGAGAGQPPAGGRGAPTTIVATTTTPATTTTVAKKAATTVKKTTKKRTTTKKK